MIVKVGIIGLGSMGQKHFNCYKALEDAELVAICDIDESKFTNTIAPVGNVKVTKEPLDLTGIELYTDFDKMLSEANLDAVSITLPTYLHSEYTIKALQAGVSVLCEKPMAIDLEQCDRMIAAAENNGKFLQIGHCIRFWPEYARTKEIISSAKYGETRIATFQRLIQTPLWSWDNWMMDKTRSGGAALDLHIHDADFVQYLFGMPKAVYSQGAIGPSGSYDHMITHYLYDDDHVIMAEGGWIMTPPSLKFEMRFNILLENATILFDYGREPNFQVYPGEGEPFIPKVEKGDGYLLEIDHFLKTVTGKNVCEITTPEQSRNSVKIINAEKDSALSGNKVILG